MVERIEINLLPVEYRVHKQRIKLPREIVYPLLGVALIGLVLAYLTIAIESETAGTRQEIQSITQQIQGNKTIKDEIAKLRKDHQAIQEKIRALERINVNREKWVALLEIFCVSLPDYTWLLSVEERSGSVPQVMQIQGHTYDFPEVGILMTKLAESEYISAVDLSSIEQLNDEDKAYRFNISCQVNPDAGLTKLVQ